MKELHAEWLLFIQDTKLYENWIKNIVTSLRKGVNQ